MRTVPAIVGILTTLACGSITAAEIVPPEPMLSAHNQVRSQHGIPPLRWSERLAQDASAWADHLVEQESCKMVHSDSGQGENLFWASPVYWSERDTAVQPVTPEDVVESWASEQQVYDYARNTCLGPMCGHYTQIVWETTTEVGCAKRICPNNAQVWVCRYSPPGNVVGQRPY